MKFHQIKLFLSSALLFAATLLAIGWLQGSAPVAQAKSVEMVATAPLAESAATNIANIPNAFSYQGSLRLADGSLATGSYNVTLKIYNAVTGGTALHSETYTNTVVRNGNFSVIVGDAKPISPTLFDNANLYIGVTVAPDPEMLPRQRLFPVPWAVQASQALNATNAASAAIATTLVKDATINGLIIDKGTTNEGALKVTSSGPGWGSGIRFQNTTANRTYGIYVAQDGAWHFVDETAGASRLYFHSDGTAHFNTAIATTQNLYVSGDTQLQSNLQVIGSIISNNNISSASNISALGKVYASQGFNGKCGSDPGAVGLLITCNQDVAETFASEQRTEPGDLVVFVPSERTITSVRRSAKPYEKMIVGVVSSNPGLVFDEGKTFLAGDNSTLITDKKTVVAMVGRVPTKFSLENGPINIGDPLTSSSKPGVAMKATKAGQIIGYAMQSSKDAKDGKLLVWLQLGTYVPQDALDTFNEIMASYAPKTIVTTSDKSGGLSIADLQIQIAELSAQVAKLQAGK
ncbi:MAG: hypothetical protein U0175_22550 [Caldilineaceae bacterium]